MTYVPPVRINSADDLEAAVKWAGEDEKNRWYVARMARAYKRADIIPKDWDVTESEQPNERRLTSEQAMIDSAVIDDAVEHEAPITAAAGKKRRTQKIQTQAGVKRYGAPIGTPIIKKDGKLVADTSAVVRLRSETGDEKASPKAPNNKIVATPPENLEEGDEIVTKKGVELVVVSSTPNDKGGYTVVVEDADGLAQSFDIDKAAKIQLLEDDDELDDDAPETPAKSAREKLDEDFKNAKVSVTEYARKKGLIETAEIQDGQAKGEIKADDDLTAADVNAAYKRWNDLKKAKAPKPEIERAERQYKHVHKAVVNKPAPEKGAPKPEDLGEDTRDTATKAKHDAYDAARAKDFKGPAIEPEAAKPSAPEGFTVDSRGTLTTADGHGDIVTLTNRTGDGTPVYAYNYDDAKGNRGNGQEKTLDEAVRAIRAIQDTKPAKPAGRDYKAEQQARTVDREKAAADKAALELTKTHRATIARVKDAIDEKDLNKRLPILQSIVNDLQTARDNADPNPDVRSSGDIPLSTMHHPDVRDARNAIDVDLDKAKSALANTERKISQQASENAASDQAAAKARSEAKRAAAKAAAAKPAVPTSGYDTGTLQKFFDGTRGRNVSEILAFNEKGQRIGAKLDLPGEKFSNPDAENAPFKLRGGMSIREVDEALAKQKATKPASEPAAETKKTSPRIEELSAELERTRAEWREKNDAVGKITDKNSREYAQAKFEALVAKVKAGRAYADHMSAVYDAGDGPRGAAYDDKRAAWSRNMDMTNQAIAAITKELAAHDKRDAELRRQGFGGRPFDHGEQQLPLNGRNGRGMTDAQLRRGVEANKAVERATQEARTAELRAKESAPSESHDPAGERDPQRMRANANYQATLSKWMNERPIEFEMEYDSARKEAKKAGDDNTAKAKRARLNLAIITAIGEDTGMVKNGRIKRNQGLTSKNLREVADKTGASPATPEPADTPETPETPDTPDTDEAPVKVTTLSDLLGGNKDSRAEKLKELTSVQLTAAKSKSSKISSQLKERGRIGDRGTILKHERLQASILDEEMRRSINDGSRKTQELTDDNLTNFLAGESYGTGELAREFGVPKATMQRRLAKLRDQGILESSVDEDVAGANGSTSVSGGRSRIEDLNWMLVGGRDATPPTPAAPAAPENPRAAAMERAKATAQRVNAAEGLAPAIFDTIRELTPADKPSGYVGLTRLREALGDIATREEIDETLRSFGRGGSKVGASLIPEENQKTLTQADRDNGVAIGGKTSHLIALDEYSTRPAAAKAAPAAPTAPAAPSFDGITPDDAAELIATGLSDTEVKNALSARYPSEREQKAFNRGWERSRDPRRKDFDAYTNGMNLAEEKAFSDGWQAVLANPAPRATPAVTPVAQRRRDIIDGARNPDPVVDTPADAAADASKREYDLDQALDGKVDATGEPLTAGKQYRVNRGSKAWVIDSINKDGKSFTMVGAEPDSTGKSRRRLKVTPAMMKPFTEPSSPSTPDVPSTPNTPANEAPNLDGIKDNNGNALDLNTTYALNDRGGRGWTIDSVTDTGLINLSIPSGTDGKRRRWNVDPKKLRPVGGTTTPAEPTPTPAPAPEPLASDDQLAALRARLAERTAETPDDAAERQTRERANALGALQQESRSLEDVLTTNAAAQAEVEAAQSTGDAARISAAQLRHARTQKDAIMARSDYRRALREAKIAGVPGEQLPDTPQARPVPAPAPARQSPTARKAAAADRERQARRLANRREQERFDKLANERLDDPAAELAAAEAAYASIRGDRVRVGLIAPVMQRLTEARAAASKPSAAPKPEPVVAKPEAPAAPRAAIEELFTRAEKSIDKYGPSGEPYQTSVRAIDGHKVQIFILKGATEKRYVNIDGSLEELTIEQALARIAPNTAAPVPEPEVAIPTPAGATKTPTHKVGQTSRVLNVLLRTNQRKIDEINERITNGDATADDRASLKLYEREIQKLRGEVERGEWQSPDALVERAIANGTPEAPARKTVADMDIDELTKAVNDPNATDAQIDAALAEIERRDAAEAAANAPGPIADMTMDELEAFIGSPDTSEADMLAAIDEMDRRERGDDEPDSGGTPAPEPDDYTPIDTGWGASDPDDDGNDEASKILALIETGMNPMEAEAQVTGKKVETIMRRDGLRWLRETYTISDTNRFEDALTEAYQQAVHEAITDSEKYTAGGYHINMGARTRGNISERTSDLFTQNETTAMANASHELREFWDANGRITKDGFRNRVWAAIGAPRAGTGQYSSGAAGGFLQ